MMKRLLTSIIIALLGGGLLTACSRAHRSEYHGVASKMNYQRQIVNPQAPINKELAPSTGDIGEKIYRRYSDSYLHPIPITRFRQGAGSEDQPTGN